MTAFTPLEQYMQTYLELWRQGGTRVFDLKESTTSDNVLNFYSNDYLGISRNPDVKRAYIDKLLASDRVMGSNGSRHNGGNSYAHVRLEKRLAEFFRGESALLFNTGYEANGAFCSSIPQEGDIVLYDEICHTSIVEGLRRSNAFNVQENVMTFRHSSVTDLASKLRTLVETRESVREASCTVWVFIESLYSFDGDFSPATELYRTMSDILPPGVGYMLIDEAHSTGIMGRDGRGLTNFVGLDKYPNIVRLHTFSKAMGITGAVMIMPELMRHYLIYASKNFIFTAALAQYHVLAIEAAFDFLDSPAGIAAVAEEKEKIAYARQCFAEQLASVPHSVCHVEDGPDFSVNGYKSPIMPVRTPFASNLSKHLEAFGTYSRPGLYPIVAIGRECLRISIQAKHSKEDIRFFTKIVGDWAREQARLLELQKQNSFRDEQSFRARL